jgi:heptosyltransferase-2
MLTEVVNGSETKHEVQRNLDVIRFLGGDVRDDRLELWLRPEDEFFAGQLLKSEQHSSGQRFIALGVGTRHPKRWPIENFVALGRELIREYKVRLIVLGDDKDAILGQRLQQELGDAVLNMAGHSTLRETAATLRGCSLYVGNDTGPLHMAAAVGTPVVGVSSHSLLGAAAHSNSPLRFGPWKVPHRMVQPERPTSPCTEWCAAKDAPHCIRQVTVEAVTKAAHSLLAGQ